MKKRQAIKIFLGLTITMIVVVLSSSYASAESWASTFTGGLSNLLSSTQNILSGAWIGNLLLAILTFLIEALGKLIDLLSSAIASILTWPATTNMSAIATVWKQLRDICNMFFIVILIGISFATIFNVFPRFRDWDARKALSGLIIAAIVINFSLPIGQAITGFGNFLTTTMVGMFPNVGNQLIETLKPAITLASGFRTETDGDAGVSMANETNLSAAESKRYVDCVQEAAPTTWDTVRNASSTVVSWLTGVRSEIKSRYKTPVECFAEITATRQKALGATASQGTSSPGTMLVISALMNVGLLTIVASCLATVLIFLLVRIIAIWVLLALSPLPFFALAVPGGGGGDNKLNLSSWFRQIIAWNMFGPLYLFVLGLGLVFLSNGQGEFMTGIISQGGVPIFNIFQILIFYFFAVFVFVGGLGVVVKSTFATTMKGTMLVGGLAGKVGIFDTMGSAPARFIGRRTGITDNAQALGERFRQGVGDTRTRIQGRLPTLMQSQEEALAKARERFGVRKGGGEQAEKLYQDRIKETRKRIEEPLKARVQELEMKSSQAKTLEERDNIQRQIKRTKDTNTEELRKLSKSGNRDVALAASESLMEDDKLSADELQGMAQKYAAISPAALSGFVERRDKTLIKNAPKHKFKDAAEMQQYISVIGNPKKAEEYYKELKKGKSKVIALQVGGDLHMEKKPNGEDFYKPNELLVKEAPKFTPEDWVEVEALMEKRAEAARDKSPNRNAADEMTDMDKSGDFRNLYLQKFLSSNSVRTMKASSKDPQQILRIEEVEDFLGKNKELQKDLEKILRRQKIVSEPEKSGGIQKTDKAAEKESDEKDKAK